MNLCKSVIGENLPINITLKHCYENDLKENKLLESREHASPKKKMKSFTL